MSKQKTDSVSFPGFPITPWNFSNTSGVYQYWYKWERLYFTFVSKAKKIIQELYI